MTTAAQIKHFSRELGFTWKKALLLMALGAGLGVVMALVIPLQIY
jgi:hypothetical protein